MHHCLILLCNLKFAIDILAQKFLNLFYFRGVYKMRNFCSVIQWSFQMSFFFFFLETHNTWWHSQTVVFQIWFLCQQHQNYLATCSEANYCDIPQTYWVSNLGINPLQGSAAQLKNIALEIQFSASPGQIRLLVTQLWGKAQDSHGRLPSWLSQTEFILSICTHWISSMRLSY